MANIIIKDSRCRVVKMQKDLINQVLKTDNKDRKNMRFKDFQQVSKEGGLYNTEHPERRMSLSYDNKNKKIIERG